MAEEDPGFRDLLNIEYTGSEPFDFYKELRKLNNQTENSEHCLVTEKRLNKRKNKMKTFGVFHIFDVDGGFGDAIPQEELICTFNSEEEAKGFIKKFEKPHVYDCPYQCLECGQLELRELPTTYNEKDFWWLSEEEEEDYWYGYPKLIDCFDCDEEEDDSEGTD